MSSFLFPGNFCLDKNTLYCCTLVRAVNRPFSTSSSYGVRSTACFTCAWWRRRGQVTDAEAEVLELWSTDLWGSAYQRHSSQAAREFTIEASPPSLLVSARSVTHSLQPNEL